MAIGGINVGHELLNVPMGDMVRSLALAVADAQWQLDKASMTVAELMSGQRLVRDLDTGELENPNADGSPRVIDSRVYFGYDYDEDGKRTPQKVSMMESSCETAKSNVLSTPCLLCRRHHVAPSNPQGHPSRKTPGSCVSRPILC